MRTIATHCKRGHELTPENTIINKANGYRKCRKCDSDRRFDRRNGKRVPILTLEQRFWNMVEKTDTCWNWKGALNGAGYGMISDRAGTTSGSTAKRAHRVSFELHQGAIPEGMHLLHSCDNPRCVNPAHLAVGTNQDNIADRVSKGRSYWTQQTHCKQGHEWAANTFYDSKNRRTCRACSNIRSSEYYHRKQARLLSQQA